MEDILLTIIKIAAAAFAAGLLSVGAAACYVVIKYLLKETKD